MAEILRACIVIYLTKPSYVFRQHFYLPVKLQTLWVWFFVCLFVFVWFWWGVTSIGKQFEHLLVFATDCYGKDVCDPSLKLICLNSLLQCLKWKLGEAIRQWVQNIHNWDLCSYKRFQRPTEWVLLFANCGYNEKNKTAMTSVYQEVGLTRKQVRLVHRLSSF